MITISYDYIDDYTKWAEYQSSILDKFSTEFVKCLQGYGEIPKKGNYFAFRLLRELVRIRLTCPIGWWRADAIEKSSALKESYPVYQEYASKTDEERGQISLQDTEFFQYFLFERFMDELRMPLEDCPLHIESNIPRLRLFYND